MAPSSKHHIIKFLSLILLVSISWACVLFWKMHAEQRLVFKLKKEGVRREAHITLIRRYLPPKGKDGYGEIFYEYHNIKGEILKGRGFVSQSDYEKFHPGDAINIVYDPDDPRKSKFAFTIDR